MTEVIKVEPNLIDKLQDFGAFDVSACFNCGTCTASCPLVKDDNLFPRGLIRLAQLGQKDRLISSKELWMCYYCGDCTANCPRGANPAEFMQSARKYAIAEFDSTGISKLFNKHKIWTLFVMTMLGILFGTMIEFSNIQQWFANDYELLGGNYGEIIHVMGVVSMIALAIIVFLSVRKMIIVVRKTTPIRYRSETHAKIPLIAKSKLLVESLSSLVVHQVVKQENFKAENPIKGIDLIEGNYPEYVKQMMPDSGLRISRWLIHMSIVWGFAGLLFATLYDYIVKDLILGKPGEWVPIYHPVRLIAIISGLAMMFGVSASIYYRTTKPEGEPYYQNTYFDDWLLLILIWFIGLTGFLLTILVYLPVLPTWSSLILIIHVVLVGELFFMLPFTKFAHIMYRPLALWMLEYEERKISFVNTIGTAGETIVSHRGQAS